MARAVDADELIRHAEETKITAIFPNYTEFSPETRNAIGMYGQYWKTLLEDAPTIEAEPVKHGKWVIAKDKDGFAMWDACSSCGHGLHYVCEGKRFPYCPNCGARMDGDSK